MRADATDLDAHAGHCRRWCCLGLLALVLGFLPMARVDAESILLVVGDVPADGFVMADVDLTSAVRWCGVGGENTSGIRAVTTGGQTVPIQFVPGVDFDAQQRVQGVLVARMPAGTRTLRLELGVGGALDESWNGVVATAHAQVTHDAAKLGGLPSRVVFRGTGKALESVRWQDRTYHAEHGASRLIDDPESRVVRIADGPLCTAVRVSGRFVRSDGTQPASKPEAVYQWIYLHDSPLVYVTAVQRQQQAFAWSEAHFLELHQSGDELPHWAGGDPSQAGDFQGDQQSRRFGDWAVVHDGRNAVAVLRSGEMLIYDGKGGYGPYLHAHGALAWTPWSEPERKLSAWLWIGSAEDPARAIRQAAERLPNQASVTVTVERVRSRLEQARDELTDQAGRLSEKSQRAARFNLAIAGRLEKQGRFQQALDAASGRLPQELHRFSAGDLGLLVEQSKSGLQTLQLCDMATSTQLLASKPLPLFSLVLRKADTKEEISIGADDGWQQTHVTRPAAERLRLEWSGGQREDLNGLRVTAAATADEAASAIRWSLEVENADGWVLRRIVFPQVALAHLGPEADVVFPRGCGEVQRGLWQRAFQYSGPYPTGWTSMQWMAAYEAKRQTGLYLAVHDPAAATKDLRVESRSAEQTVVMAFSHPAPEMDQPGNGFRLSGEAVWQLLRGDWFDAARIYRDWACQSAQWWPKLGADGRDDTPAWMRELPVWALASGAPASVVPQVKQFAEALGVPVGVHWYNWHQIPFDNDYPHYFPTHPGFAEGVAELQREPIYVMPYINGRLWDTRDRGAEDFEFTKVALPGATKDERGQPYVETYGSKESDGSPVRLAAMCPTTDVWRNKVRDIVGRLTNECGVKAVYIDQVAAASPQLCFDRTHGHPTGGGAWWPAAYWKLLQPIQDSLPPDRMLTTECNAEPYVHVFDGYLTWHWQYDGQVPAFPAVYGGTLQMFGRAYRGGESKDLALRMKAGQQLVFGEQIGWLSPSVVNEPENFPFFRQTVRLRWLLRRYFHAGEMARPPKLIGEIPRVTADWQWSGHWPVTTDAVLAGARRLPQEKRLVLLFVNVADQPISLAVDADGGSAGLTGDTATVVEWTSDGPSSTWTTPRAFRRELTLPARTVRAWELRGG